MVTAIIIKYNRNMGSKISPSSQCLAILGKKMTQGEGGKEKKKKKMTQDTLRNKFEKRSQKDPVPPRQLLAASK